jgi:hypothetical protein
LVSDLVKLLSISVTIIRDFLRENKIINVIETNYEFSCHDFIRMILQKRKDSVVHHEYITKQNYKQRKENLERTWNEFKSSIQRSDLSYYIPYKLFIMAQMERNILQNKIYTVQDFHKDILLFSIKEKNWQDYISREYTYLPIKKVQEEEPKISEGILAYREQMKKRYQQRKAKQKAQTQ